MRDDAQESERLAQENEALRRRIASLEGEAGRVGAGSAASWQMLIRDAPVCIATVGLDKRFLTCNRAFCDFLGYSEDELRQKTIADVTHPEDVALGMEDLRAIVQGTMTVSRVVKRYVRKDGAAVWGEVSINLVRDSEGRPLYFQPFILDVSERKRVEELSRLSAERMQALLHLNQLTEATLAETVAFALEEAIRLTQSKIGYLAFVSEDESVMTMHSWSEAAMAECAILDKPIVYPVASTGLWGEAIRQRRPVITNDYEAASPLKKGCPQGHVVVKRHMNVPVFDGSRVVIVAGVGNKSGEYEESDVQQLTLLMDGVWRLLERKRVDAELKAEMANLDAVFESSPVGMFILDETTSIVRANAAILVTCGGSASDVLHHRPGDALGCVNSTKHPRGCGHAPECPLCPARRGIESLIANGGVLHGAELPLSLVQGGESREVWLRIGAEAMLLDGRRHLCVAIEDITLRKQAEQELRTLNADLEQRVQQRTVELEASSKELEAFSYSVSHDLRAPLRVIDGFGLALLEDCEDRLDDDGKDYLRRIRAATQRMGTLIDDMLRLSRITRAEMLVETVNLTKLAWSVVDELRKFEPERVVKIKIAEGLEVAADPKLMRIVLENLLGNAWKFTAKRSEAVIEVGATGEGANRTYFVRDNGAGFNMAYADKLFAPFQRLHLVEEYPGTGIGLGTVQRIIHRHGGKVWGEGQVEEGATFYFGLQRKSKETHA